MSRRVDLKPLSEEAAILELQRLAARWPKSLGIVKHCDSASLKIVRVGDGVQLAKDPANMEGIARVRLRVDVCT